MDYGKIEKLLDKYWLCDTTLDEERELREFFYENETIPGHLLVFREVFIYQEKEKSIGLDDEFDRKILAKLESKTSRRISIMKYVVASAAVIVLFIAISEIHLKRNHQEIDTCQTPGQALVEVEQALTFISLKLNRGEQFVEKNMKEVKVMTQYIK